MPARPGRETCQGPDPGLAGMADAERGQGMLVIDDVVAGEELAALRDAAAALDFEDGRKTAGRYARPVKHNEQAADTPARKAVLEKARQKIVAHPLVTAAARPRKVARMLVSRYGPGMAYGFHVDDAVMAGSRTDLSFTLALSDAADYDGGGLMIDDALEQKVVRLKAGQMVLYTSDTLHSVEPVTRGSRLAVVGWITSWVPDPARRAILFDLDRAIAALDCAGDSPARAPLLRAKTNLLRIWAEG